MKYRRRWTESDDSQLIELHRQGFGITIVAKRMLRSRSVVRKHAKALGVHFPTGRHIWSEEEILVLRRWFPNQKTQGVADALGLTAAQVNFKAKALGIHKTQAYLESPAAGRLRRGDNVGKATRFEKGHVPANKGTRRPGWAPGRMAQTQFKKGRPPKAARNYVPIGTYRVNHDGYLQRKMTDSQDIAPARRWTPVHRLVWETAHGAIPEGHAVVFKPGQHTTALQDITPERLECISREELMRHNSIHNRYPEPVKRAIRAKAQLTRKIRRIEREKQN